MGIQTGTDGHGTNFTTVNTESGTASTFYSNGSTSTTVSSQNLKIKTFPIGKTGQTITTGNVQVISSVE